MNYLKLLQNSYKTEKRMNECAPESPLEYLGEYIFGFTTYDGEISALFAQKAVEVCDAITSQTTFEYIKDAENYRWYLLMCNMPFFASKLEWGTSIRGAWWDHKITFQSCGLWDGDEQLADKMTFTGDEWALFMAAVSEFFQANAKEHAPLSAGASDERGVDVETTGEHENRAADRGCCVSTCSPSSILGEGGAK